MHYKNTIPRRLKSYKEEDRGHDTPCWIWQGYIEPSSGYGRCTSGVSNVPTTAHKWMYAYFIGDVPAGLELDHRCHVRECCNPYRLEPVTHQENIRRGFVSRGIVSKRKKPKVYDDECLLPSERMVVSCRDQGMTYKEISTLTGKSASALRNLHSRAIRNIGGRVKR